MFWSILNLASEIFKFLKTQLGATRLRVLFSDSLLVIASSAMAQTVVAALIPCLAMAIFMVN